MLRMEPSGRDWAPYEAAPGLGAGPKLGPRGKERAAERELGRRAGVGETGKRAGGYRRAVSRPRE